MHFVVLQHMELGTRVGDYSLKVVVNFSNIWTKWTMTNDYWIAGEKSHIGVIYCQPDVKLSK